MEVNANTQKGTVSLKEIQDKFVTELNSSFCKLLAEINDALFNQSKTVSSNKIKSSYTEAMGIIRNKHDNIQDRFMDKLEERFSQLQSAPPPEQGESEVPKKFNIDKMSLIQDDELEENIAIDAMVTKAKVTHRVVLYQLVNRLNNAIDDQIINLDNNPLNPLTICEAFQFSIDHLEINVAPKLVIYKLFDRIVITPLALIYENINQSLISKGIPADLPDKPVNKQRQQKNKDIQAESEAESLDKGTDVLVALKEVLTDYNQGKSSNLINVANAETTQGIAAIPQSVIEQTALIEAISTAQSTYQQQFAVNAENISVIDFKNQVGTLLSTPQTLSDQNIGQINDNIIDIITMLFNFILDDYNLPDTFKALIARLQIPVLKVALIDESFLSTGNHPARVLINEMGQAGIGWTSELGTGLRDILTEIITRIINDFDRDTTIFSEELEKLKAFTKTQTAHAKLIERRVRETEEGKVRRQSAENAAIAAIKEIIGGLRLPPAVDKLLFVDWKNAMQMVYLRKGIDSEKWQKYLKTASELVASLFPVMTTPLREDLENRLPDLIDDLKTGLDLAALDEFESNELFEELDAIFQQVLEGESVFIELLQEDAQDDDGALLIEETAVDQTQAEEADGGNDYRGFLIKQPVAIEEEIELDVEFNAIQLDEDGTYDEMQYSEQVANLQVGSWFKINEHPADDLTNKHCKLAAIIDSVDKYIFVNHAGRKVTEFTKSQLGEALINNHVIQLEKGALFERALKSMISDFRTLKRRESDT